jgi:hypothetical protein
MKRLERELQRRLRRFECPSPQQLGDYQAGMLDAESQRAVSEHIAVCPRCEQELQTLVEFMNLADEVPAVENILELFPSQGAGEAVRVRTAGNLALKGSQDDNVHDIKIGSATIFLEWTAGQKGFLLTGQVLDLEVSWVGAIAEVWQGETLHQVNALDDQGEFRFEFPAALVFDLRLTALDGNTLVVERITIQD